MAYADTQSSASNFRQVLLHPFAAIGRVLDSVSEALSMAEAANRVAEMSDEALAAKNLTRAEAIELVFSKNDT